MSDPWKILSSEKGFAFWFQQPYAPPDLSVLNPNILIVPMDGFRSTDGPIFPSETDNLLNFIKKNSNKHEMKIVSDICIKDDEYRTYSLYFDWWDLPWLVITGAASTVAGTILKEYVKQKMDKLGKKKQVEQGVRFRAIIEGSSGQKCSIEYEGSAEVFEKTVDKIIVSARHQASAPSDSESTLIINHDGSEDARK